jgi:His-Xaa-Ser system radical SAM maturase HxsB
MDEKKYRFLIKHDVKICTSLDGPEKLHNKNRPYQNGNSYQKTVEWIRKATKGKYASKIGALTTISKFSLDYPKEIVDEYLKWNINEIHLRPLSFLGFSGKAQSTIGYSAQEFFVFWKKAMDYIIEKNLQGKFFRERGSRIILEKILTLKDPGFVDLRSPCGAGIGQILYNYDGKVYTCDEGRMIGDDTFMIGNIKKDNYKKIAAHPTIKTMCIASLLEDNPCDKCVYKPYCGVCPVQNYAIYGNIFPKLKENERCTLHKKIFDYLFQKLENKRIEKVFRSWVR